MAKRPFVVFIRPPAMEELDALRLFDHRRIVQAIRANLVYEPFVENRNRKMLEGLNMTDPEFWRMIRERRASNEGIPLEEAEARLAERERRERTDRAKKRKKNSKKGK